MARTLYHGSKQIIEHPQYGLGAIHNDYGQGFYCTEHLELAKEWACPIEGADGYANEYELDDKNLTMLDLGSDDYTALHWLAILLKNRLVDTKLPIAQEGKRYLEENFSIDTTSFDLIKGWRADDSYFSFARAFLNNAISYEQLTRAMMLGDLGNQIVLVSERSFEHIRFVRAHPSPARLFHPKRLSRDENARTMYRGISKEMGIEGLYLRDIIVERMEANDARLRR